MISSVFSPLGCILLFFKTQFLPRTFGISKHLLRFQESVKSSKFKDHVPLKIFYVLRSTYVHKNKQLFLGSSDSDVFLIILEFEMIEEMIINGLVKTNGLVDCLLIT